MRPIYKPTVCFIREGSGGHPRWRPRSPAGRVAAARWPEGMHSRLRRRQLGHRPRRRCPAPRRRRRDRAGGPRPGRLDAAVKRITGDGPEVVAVSADSGDEQALTHIFKEFGVIDHILVTAGALEGTGPVRTLTPHASPSTLGARAPWPPPRRPP